jgi:hypothetical protein
VLISGFKKGWALKGGSGCDCYFHFGIGIFVNAGRQLNDISSICDNAICDGGHYSWVIFKGEMSYV